MQTFLPHPNFAVSVWCLDRSRLGKQRSEARQMQAAIQRVRHATGVWRPVALSEWSGMCRQARDLGTEKTGWAAHSCTTQWVNHMQALMLYGDVAIQEWVRRGYQNNMSLMHVPGAAYLREIEMPPWLGTPELHASHRSKLLEKDPLWYEQFSWTEEPGREYVWGWY